ncbi:hypothetical protein M3Y94_00014600 [Aphelenchoides besseyi]|nr:hypothetical protein M3Y94_00014600 [Aphelenchoides besseyi]
MDSIVDSHRSLCPDTTNLNKKMFIPCDQYAWIYSAIDIAEITLGLTSAVIVGFSLYVFVCCPIFSRNMTSIGYTIGANFYAILLFRFIAIFLYMANGKSTFALLIFTSSNADELVSLQVTLLL